MIKWSSYNFRSGIMLKELSDSNTLVKRVKNILSVIGLSWIINLFLEIEI